MLGKQKANVLRGNDGLICLRPSHCSVLEVQKNIEKSLSACS